MTEVTLSVVIPCGAGRQQNLRFCLYGLSLQTNKDFEVIVAANADCTEIAPIVGAIAPELGATHG